MGGLQLTNKDTTLFPMELLFSALNLPTPRQPAGLPRKHVQPTKHSIIKPIKLNLPQTRLRKHPVSLSGGGSSKPRAFSCARAALRVEHFFPSGATHTPGHGCTTRRTVRPTPSRCIHEKHERLRLTMLSLCMKSSLLPPDK